MPTSKLNRTVIEAAIVGFEQQKTQIDTQIAELRVILSGDGSAPTAATPEAPTTKRKKFSAAAIKRMREAQQRRWAKVRGEAEPAEQTPTPTQAPKPKRKLSAAARAALVANLKKARAAKAAKANGAAGAKKTAPALKAKRKLSAAGRAAVVAANKKMWERRRAAAKTA